MAAMDGGRNDLDDDDLMGYLPYSLMSPARDDSPSPPHAFHSVSEEGVRGHQQWHSISDPTLGRSDMDTADRFARHDWGETRIYDQRRVDWSGQPTAGCASWVQASPSTQRRYNPYNQQNQQKPEANQQEQQSQSNQGDDGFEEFNNRKPKQRHNEKGQRKQGCKAGNSESVNISQSDHIKTGTSEPIGLESSSSLFAEAPMSLPLPMTSVSPSSSPPFGHSLSPRYDSPQSPSSTPSPRGLTSTMPLANIPQVIGNQIVSPRGPNSSESSAFMGGAVTRRTISDPSRPGGPFGFVNDVTDNAVQSPPELNVLGQGNGGESLSPEDNCLMGQPQQHPSGEHPSRTLFVRNINSNVEDFELRRLFEQFGPIRSMYTQCKHRGFVMVGYFDIRHARSAMRSLQGKIVRKRKLDIHFSIPKDNPSEKDQNQGTLVVFNLDPSVGNADLRQIFGRYGEIKEIRETPNKKHHKFIEFYDVREAERALKYLNKTEINNKRIKIEPSRPGGSRKATNLSVNSRQPTSNPQPGMMSPSEALSPTGPLSPRGVSPVTSPTLSSSSSVNFSNSNFTSSAAALYSHPSSGPIAPLAGINNYAAYGQHYGYPQQYPQTARSHPVMSHHGLQPPPNIQQAQSLPHQGHLQHLHQQAHQQHFAADTSGPMLSVKASSRMGDHDGYYELIQNNYGEANGKVESHKRRQQQVYMQHRHAPQRPGVSQPQQAVGSSHHSHNAFIDNGYAMMEQSMHTLSLDPSPLASMSLSLAPNSSMNYPYIGRKEGKFSAHQKYMHYGQGSDDAKNFDDEHEERDAQSAPGSTAFSPPSPASSSPASSLSPRQTLGSASLSPRPSHHHHHHHHRKPHHESFQLDIDRFRDGREHRTTLMIRNIPNKYTQKMLLLTIDEYSKGLYDFFYLPIDFKNKCNVGYAFINFINGRDIIPFYSQFHGKKWARFNSEKICQITFARIQGKATLINHFQNSSLMSEDERCRPLLFHSAGPLVGQLEQFPSSSSSSGRSSQKGVSSVSPGPL